MFLLPSYEAVVSCHSLLTVLINVRCHLMFLTEITKMLITDSCQHCVAELSSKHDCDWVIGWLVEWLVIGLPLHISGITSGRKMRHPCLSVPFVIFTSHVATTNLAIYLPMWGLGWSTARIEFDAFWPLYLASSEDDVCYIWKKVSARFGSGSVVKVGLQYRPLQKVQGTGVVVLETNLHSSSLLARFSDLGWKDLDLDLREADFDLVSEVPFASAFSSLLFSYHQLS